MNGNIRALATAACCLFAAACAETAPTAPSASTLSRSGITGDAEAQLFGASALPPAPDAAPTLSALSKGVTDVMLANAGWTCIQPGNGLILCGPPGLGLPPIPPAADGQPTYNIMAFTLDHEFVHKVKLLRPDLYHGQPCQGGEPWVYLAFLNYYECIIPE